MDVIYRVSIHGCGRSWMAIIAQDRILDYEIHHYFSLARPPTQPGNETMKGCAWVVEELACKISSKWSILFRGGVGQNRSMAK